MDQLYLNLFKKAEGSDTRHNYETKGNLFQGSNYEEPQYFQQKDDSNINQKFKNTYNQNQNVDPNILEVYNKFFKDNSDDHQPHTQLKPESYIFESQYQTGNSFLSQQQQYKPFQDNLKIRGQSEEYPHQKIFNQNSFSQNNYHSNTGASILNNQQNYYNKQQNFNQKADFSSQESDSEQLAENMKLGFLARRKEIESKFEENQQSNVNPKRTFSEFQGIQEKNIIQEPFVITKQYLKQQSFHYIDQQSNHPVADRYHKAQNKQKKTFNHDLSMQDGEQLLKIWRNNDYSDFNRWVQVSKSKLTVEFQENVQKHQVPFYGPGFTCFITLELDINQFGESITVNTNGFSSQNQKEARISAIEKLVAQLIQQQLIKFGLKNFDIKSLSETAAGMQEQEEEVIEQPEKFNSVGTTTPSPIKKQKTDVDKRQAYTLSRKIQEYLQYQQFPQALNLLSYILDMQSPDWSQIGCIWNYAIHEENLQMVEGILEVVFGQQTACSQKCENQDQKKVCDCVHTTFQAQRVNEKLSQLYNVTRRNSNNSFQVFDYYTLEVNDPEISKKKLNFHKKDQFFLQDVEGMKRILTNDYDENQIVCDPYDKHIAQFLVHSQMNPTQFEELPELQNIKIVNPTWPFCSFDQQRNQKEYQKIMEARSFGMVSHKVEPNGGDPIQRHSTISKQVLDHLYDSLIFSPNLKFTLEACQRIYTRAQLDSQGFLNPYAVEYYGHKRNLLAVDIIDNAFRHFSSNSSLLNNNMRSNPQYLCALSGTILRLGTTIGEDIILLSPNERKDAVENQLLKRNKVDVKDSSLHFIEGDVIILTSFFTPTYEVPMLKEQTSSLAAYINSQTKQALENIAFVNSITEYGNIVQFALIAIIKEITPNNKIRLQYNPNPSQYQGIESSQGSRVWKISKLCSRTTHQRISQALTQFCTDQSAISTPLMHIIMTPPGIPNPWIEKMNTDSQQQYHGVRVLSSLNEQQDLAVRNCTKQILSAVQGPPGTGKTTTGVEIVIEWLRKSSQPILVCAESQNSVDNLYVQMTKAGIKAVRIGPGFQEQFQTVSSSKNLSMTTWPYQKNVAVVVPTSMKFAVLQEIIRDGRVIICTCLSASTDYLKNLQFSRVLIDNAHRISESLTLLPLIQSCQQLVLLGDHYLPSDQSASIIAQSKGSSMSLLQKLISQGLRPFKLDVQYKIHPSMVNFPSQYYYGIDIDSGISESDRELVKGFPWKNEQTRCCIVNVEGKQDLSKTGGIYNVLELEVLIRILMGLLEAQFIKFSDIGILTSTEQQKLLIQNEITHQAKKFPHLFAIQQNEIYRITQHSVLVDVDTLDRANIMNQQVILFSAVRTNKYNGIGSLQDPKQMNALLWNGKKGLIIIGDIKHYSESNIHWREFLTWNKKQDLIYDFQKESSSFLDQ